MNKKVYMKNRPFDEIDANQMVTWMEDSINQTVSNMFSAGVLTGLNVTPGSGLGVIIEAGRAYDINYRLLNVVANQNVVLEVANTNNPRIDLITVKFNATTTNTTDTANKYGMGTGFIYSQNIIEAFTIEVIKGIAAASPVAPATPVGNVVLAEVTVPKLSTSLVTGNIVDKRIFYVISDDKINYRIIDDTKVPVSNTAYITDQFSGLANRIKAITGKNDWKTAPAITLETVSVYLNQGVKTTDAPVFAGLIIEKNGLRLLDQTTPTKIVYIGYDTAKDSGFINAINEGVSWKPLTLGTSLLQASINGGAPVEVWHAGNQQDVRSTASPAFAGLTVAGSSVMTIANAVDLTTAQTISGAKRFSSRITADAGILFGDPDTGLIYVSDGFYYLQANGVNVLEVKPEGINVGGSYLRRGGNTVWDEGNVVQGSIINKLGYTPVNKAGDTMSGQLLLNAAMSYGNIANSPTGGSGLQVTSAGSGHAAYIGFHKPGNYAAQFGLDTDNYFSVGGGSMGVASYRIFTGGTENTAAGNTSYGSRVVRNTIMSTGGPSGGSNGDIWMQYI